MRRLLKLVEQHKGKEAKATIASNIMYIVGQFPKFMSQNFSFLKTVCKKLFDFMHESFPGVKDMAVNTLHKITQSCKSDFVNMHASENNKERVPYIEEILNQMGDHIKDLEQKNVLIFYESLGCIISSEKNPQ